MEVAVFGIKGDLSVRERAFSHLLQACEALSQEKPLVLLVTCHRFEVYFTLSDTDQTLETLRCLAKQNDLEKYSYLHLKKECFFHLCKTASGLDSLIVGESEIQRQVKKAYRQYKHNLPFPLHYLFQKSLMISKQIRTKFLHQSKSFKLGSYLLNSMINNYTNPKVLFVGNSEMNRSILSYFKMFHNIQLSMCSRFEIRMNIHTIPWKQLHRWTQFDVLICASKQTSFCICPQQTVKKISIFDLSVPRCVDPSLSKDRNISLKNIDEIYAAISSNKEMLEKKCLLFIEARIDRLTQLYENKEKYKQEIQKAAC